MIFRTGLALVLAGSLSACFTVPDLRPASTLESLGDFKLGFAVVDPVDVTFGPYSHELPKEILKSGFEAAIKSELSGFSGQATYHIGVKLDAISLTERDVAVSSPLSSVVVMSVSIWNDSTGAQLLPNPELLVVKNGYDAKAILGRGSAASAEEKLAGLAAASARRIEQWLKENGQWFGVAAVPPSADDLLASEAALNLLVPEGGTALAE